VDRHLYHPAMAIIFLAVDSITDLPLLREYQQGVGPVISKYPHDLIAYDEAAQPHERIEDTRRVVVLRFESEETFRAFYDSPEYQAVIGKRLRATEGFAVLVNVS
jgi:uncharacterized protein (DUF1330 family)